jgi:DNA-binding MarR family transcriptional regulator
MGAMKPSGSAPARAALVGEALVAMMVAAGSLVRDLDAACQQHGITHDQYNILRILRGVYPGGHPRGEIAARLISRAPDVTRTLDRLVQRDLVRRGWHPKNRRLSMATITDKGLALLAEVDQLILREHARYTEGVTIDELTGLRRVCQRMTP